MRLIYDFNAYQEDIKRFVKYPDKVAPAYLISGLCAEAGEVAGKFAKFLRSGEEEMSQETRDAIALEVGDVLWFAGMLATLYGFDMADIAMGNVNKLQDRLERDVIKGEGDYR